MLTGLLIAALASIGSGLGSAIEALGVRRAADHSGQPGELGPLLRTPRYLGGLAVDLLGFVFTVMALQLLPLFLVQSIVAASVGVTAVFLAATGRPLGRSAWWALAASLVGLVMLGFSSAPHNGAVLAAGWQWVLLGSAVPLALFGLLVERAGGRASAPLLGLTAGLAFSGVAIAARGLDLPDPAWRLITLPAVWAIAVLGILGTIFFARGMQHGRVTVVAAVSFTTTTVLPSAIGLAFLGDQIRPGYQLLASAGFLIAVLSAIALARFAGPLPDQHHQPDQHTPDNDPVDNPDSGTHRPTMSPTPPAPAAVSPPGAPAADPPV
jgi:drug/metabolite transporter (DMT)-like permease